MKKNEKGSQEPKALTSEELTGIRTGKHKEVAAGVPAVFVSMKHVFTAMGPVRGGKALLNLNQKGGIDCPGCAWPDPDDERSSMAEYCENGAKAIAEEATSKKVETDFFAENSVYGLSLLSDYEIGKEGRIAQPMYLKVGATHYEEITWDDAFKLIAKHLNKLESPDGAIFYTSGRTSNEAAFLYQLFVREYGTNNLPDCSNMCHESTSTALSESIGIGKGTVKLEDFYQAEVIMIMGQNPGTNHPRMLSALQKGKRNGATIIAVNPIVETGLLAFSNPQEVKGMLGIHTSLTDIYLQVHINGDLALLQALAKLMLEQEDKNPGSVFDQDFIKEKTHGAMEYLEHIRSVDMEELLPICGIPLEKLKETAAILCKKKKIIICWAMGLTQHKNAVYTIKEVINLLLLKGSIGKPGAGACPVRGHSNVQGDRTVGIFDRPSKELLDSLQNEFGFDPPREDGYDVVKSVEAMHNGKAKVFFGMGGNFSMATPDTEYTAEGLRKCDLTVHVSTKLNRSHLVHGKEALILPCYARTDKDFINGELQFLSVENSTGVVHSTRGSLTPISDKLMSEPYIVCNLAKATLRDSKIDWDAYMSHYDAIRDSIAACIPGFSEYNKKVRQPGGFYLPNAARYNEYKTETGKANFNIRKVEPHPIKNDEFMMMTIRSHDQFNTTIYGLNDRYRGVYNERRIVFMNAEDMKRLQLREKDLVDLYNHHDNRERKAPKFVVIPYNIPQGAVATYLPEANVLVPITCTSDKSNQPTSKSVVITIKKHEPGQKTA